jgi:lysozyme
MRAIPQIAVKFVAAHEGFRDKAYLCSANVPTIGYGHTDGVKLGDTCTKAQALKWLAVDMQDAQRKIYALIKPDVIDALTEHQWSALLSFVFNLGLSSKWQLVKRINARQFDQVPMELAKFVNAGGRKVMGLVKRRADEQVLWATDEPGSTGEAMPSSITRGVGVTPPTPADPTPAVKTPPVILGLLGAATAGAPLVDQARRAVEPYSTSSEMVQRMLGILSMIGACLAVAAIAVTWLKHRESRR